MQKTDVLMVIGTRPEAVKMAPLYHILKANTQKKVCLCVTAQHRTMLDPILDFFEMTPDVDLNLMAPGQSLFGLSGGILTGLESVFTTMKPALTLVHGDTTTSCMAALASYYAGVRVGHVEAGLRTNHKKSPFPEEINRQITSRIADLHFAPTEAAKRNLLQENIPKASIEVTGNTVVDALQYGVNKLLEGYADAEIERLQGMIDPAKKTILVTGHRRENAGDGMRQICLALQAIALRNDVQMVYPVHLNPQIQHTVRRLLNASPNIHLVAPLGYPAFLWLLTRAFMILTDSGGIQEEAPSLKKPVLVLRENTERPEAIEAGCALLVGTNNVAIVRAVSQLLDDPQAYRHMVATDNPYGDGNASRRIADRLAWHSEEKTKDAL